MEHNLTWKVFWKSISLLQKCKIQIRDQLYLKYILKYLGMIVFKIHVKILSMYLKYYFKYMYFKILPITGGRDAEGGGVERTVSPLRVFFLFFHQNSEFWCILGSILCDLDLKETERQKGKRMIDNRAKSNTASLPGEPIHQIVYFYRASA